MHSTSSWAARACAAVVLLAGSAASASPPRTILHNGQIFTADPAHPWAQAVAIEGNRITDVGTDAQVLGCAHHGAVVYDLGGRTVIPGLNDAHVHVSVPAGVSLNTNGFLPGPGPTLSDVLALVAQGAATTPPGTWLFASVGTALLDDPGANRFALDTVAPNHPVALFAWSGHGTIVDTKGLATLGIGLHAADPFGGTYERVAGGSTLTGVAHEYAEYGIRRRLLSTLSDADLVGQFQTHAAQSVQLGVTSIQDMPVGLTHARALQVLAAANLSIRVRSICFPLTPDESCDAHHGQQGPLVTASGIKWVTDGTPIERMAFVTEAYQDRPGFFGHFNFSYDPLLDMVGAGFQGPAAENQLLFHAVGDGAVSRVLDALEETGGDHAWRKRRPRIEHGDLLLDGDIERVQALGAVIVQNATHLALTPVFAQRFSSGVLSNMEPLRSLLDAGIPLALGTDGIGARLSPFVDIFLAAIHPTRPDEALSVEQAVTAYTRGSAFAEHTEKDKGSIAPGKLADLAVLSQDIFHAPLPAVPGTYSMLTIVDGAVVWNAGLAPSP